MQLSAISRSCEQIECQNMLRPWNALTNLHQGSYSARTWQRVYSQSSLTPLERKDHLFLDAMQISCFCLLQGDSSCTLQRVDSHGLSFSRFKQLQRNGRPWELTTVTHHTSYCMTLLYLHLLTCCNFPGRPFVVHSFDIVPRTKREISDCWWLGDVSLLMMLPNVADALIFWRFQSWHPAERWAAWSIWKREGSARIWHWRSIRILPIDQSHSDATGFTALLRNHFVLQSNLFFK